jgi:hypothetical protein
MMSIAINIDALGRSCQIAQTGLPDLTQPQSLNQVAGQLPIAIAIFVILAIGLGAGMALVNFSMRNSPQERNVVFGDWAIHSAQLLRGLQQTVVVAILLLMGFLLCSTLANRQSSWEQARLTQKTPDLAGGEVVQQASPQVTYTSQEPYVYTTQLGGKLVKVQDKKDVTRQTSVSGSNLQVVISPTPTKTGDSNNYSIDFKGDYQITNPVGTTDRFAFKIAPPSGYSLLQNFTVERDGKRLTATNPGEYSFPLQIAPGSVSKLRVSYLAQGSPQWVYSAKDGSLANFRMSIATKVPRIDFVSGVVPTKVDVNKDDSKIFTWAFNRNASVQKPFGVSVASPVAVPTGKLPLLLVLAPGIFLWWVTLLCFSIPMRLPNIAISGFVFFAGMFALTYFSRLTEPLYVWGGISIGLLILVWGLGRGNWRISLAAIICTIAGAIVPVYGFLLGYRGVTLSIAGLMSILWLVARNWYGWYQLEPRDRVAIDRPIYDQPDEAYVRHDLLEESAKYNQLNPAAPNAEETAKRLRDKGVTSD